MKSLKKSLALLIVLIMCFNVIGCSKKEASTKNETIRLSTTTSVNDSGLLPYLQQSFEETTGYKLEITSAGTGAAIKKGETGDADCLLVHAKASEEEFINSGYGVERVVLMYNYFVIIGPDNDPAQVAQCSSAKDAFEKIAETGSTFVSRGDDSGTNKTELKIWDSLGIDPTAQSWYISTGQGMGASITVAAEQQGYILTDKATYISHESKDQFKLLIEESEDLKNTYSAIAINPEKWPDTNIDGANAFINWMKSDEARELIASFGVEQYSEQLFYVE